MMMSGLSRAQAISERTMKRPFPGGLARVGAAKARTSWNAARGGREGGLWLEEQGEASGERIRDSRRWQEESLLFRLGNVFV
jgi:uncharacterized circularly permuted ATP-grasp superfamily protein